MMGHYGTNGWQGWMVMAMWIWPLLVGVAVWVLVALTRDWRAEPTKTTAEDPTEILRRRFANGQISQDEYLQAVATLDYGPTRAARG